MALYLGEANQGNVEQQSREAEGRLIIQTDETKLVT